MRFRKQTVLALTVFVAITVYSSLSLAWFVGTQHHWPESNLQVWRCLLGYHRT